MPGGLILVLGLVISLAFGYLLYVLVRAEHDKPEEMDRGQAERAARRDTPDHDNSN